MAHHSAWTHMLSTQLVTCWDWFTFSHHLQEVMGLASMPETNSKFCDKCFILNQHTTVEQGLEPTKDYAAYQGCHMPMSREEREISDSIQQQHAGGDVAENDTSHVEVMRCCKCWGQLRWVQRFWDESRQVKLMRRVGTLLHMYGPKKW